MQELWQWVGAAVAAYLVGLSKTGVPGLGVLSVAIFASVLPARESTGIVLVVLIAADIVSVIAYRRDVDWTQLLRILPWAAVGIVFGWLILGRIDGPTTQRLIGGILTVLIIVQLWRKLRADPNAAPPDGRARPVLAASAGVSAGIATMVANAAGPIMILYLLAMGLPKLAFIGTSAWYFFVLNLFKVPFSMNLGLINSGSLQISAILAPFAMGGAVTGRLIIRYIDQRLFEWLALGLTLVAGLRLLLW
jgi:uncharacterized membrane protein YfcA